MQTLLIARSFSFLLGDVVKKVWTKASDATLTRMWEAGANLRDIAAEVCVSHESVRKRAAFLKLREPAAKGCKSIAFSEPQHIQAHKSARRGFVVPKNLEARYVELLKTGIPISEVRQKLGL